MGLRMVHRLSWDFLARSGRCRLFVSLMELMACMLNEHGKDLVCNRSPSGVSIEEKISDGCWEDVGLCRSLNH